MSQDHMARGSKVAVLLPAISPPLLARSDQPPFHLRLARCVRSTSFTARGRDGQEGTGSGQSDNPPTRTHSQSITTVTLCHGPRAV